MRHKRTSGRLPKQPLVSTNALRSLTRLLSLNNALASSLSLSLSHSSIDTTEILISFFFSLLPFSVYLRTVVAATLPSAFRVVGGWYRLRRTADSGTDQCDTVAALIGRALSTIYARCRSY